jgi:hypothetical protein
MMKPCFIYSTRIHVQQRDGHRKKHTSAESVQFAGSLWRIFLNLARFISKITFKKIPNFLANKEFRNYKCSNFFVLFLHLYNMYLLHIWVGIVGIDAIWDGAVSRCGSCYTALLKSCGSGLETVYVNSARIFFKPIFLLKGIVSWNKMTFWSISLYCWELSNDPLQDFKF